MRCKYTNWAVIFFLGFILIAPTSVFASSCSSNGYTLVFINGVRDTQVQALQNKDVLRKNLGDFFGQEPLVYRVGYNQTHIQGVGDLFETAFPTLDQYDLNTILMQMHTDVATRKILLVGHSQGAVYANKVYEYLVTHGVPKEDVAVYAVATPESYVAGGGKYITYALDDVILGLPLAQFKPLPANANFTDLSPNAKQASGHSFIDTYLVGFGDRMVAEMQQEMLGLQSKAGDATDGCFDPPKNSLSYQIQGVGLSIADPLAAGVAVSTNVTLQGLAVIKNTTVAAVGAVAGLLGFGAEPPPPDTPSAGARVTKTGFGLIKAIAGSSLNLQDLDELSGKKQGGAVALAFGNEKGEVKGEQTEKTTTPLVPPPQGNQLFSPGFGGGGGAAESNIAVFPSAPSSTPVVVPTAVPSVVSVSSTVGIADPAPVTGWFAAATTSPHHFVVLFDQEVSVSPTIGVTANPLDLVGDIQTVTDCADSDSKTFCFDYAIPQTIEPGTFHVVHISGAANTLGSMTQDDSHRFVVDTLGPTVVVTTQAVHSALPTIQGTALTDPATVQVLLNGVVYDIIPAPFVGNWSVVLQPGQELVEGTYTITASSTDRPGNQGGVTTATLTVDMTAPVLTISSGPAEGSSVASTSPVSIEFSATDNNPGVSYACAVDTGSFAPCTSPYVSWLYPGPHSVSVQALDIAGNSASSVRNFSVLP